MIRVLGCIFQQHDLRLVVVAAGLCLLACTTALTMIARARAVDAGRSRLVWLAGAGAVAGCGIWATHFVAMLAYPPACLWVSRPASPSLSALIAMVLCGVGFALAVRIGGAVGGLVTGFAISAMHYTGMAAVELPARAVWDARYVTASLLIGISLTGLALHFALRRKTRSDYALGAGSVHRWPSWACISPPCRRCIYIPDGWHRVSAHVMRALRAGHGGGGGRRLYRCPGPDRRPGGPLSRGSRQGRSLRMRDHIAELETTQRTLQKTSDDLLVALGRRQAASKAKSAFLASMSHELRTPLNAVIGFSESMMLEVFGPLAAALQGICRRHPQQRRPSSGVDQ